ncbi:F420-non-reducing hydrogenase large subunit [Methanomicrobium sp. W14]|uniref:Ni/Fe hydrogenase subunit alpha n=1 Tax=Methanomicrobium sp. W14 TaxID=2817839 RepID=UPI001AE1C87B|nr:Ni/Fe hydrogenase subunit alpha [Methanomicrobium sp. W14]MBP2134489.1 F420-non-reducing hydrogenase large subunit [Methanomicrobium sp. W14]
MKEITISPVTRIEGHANVRIYLDEQNRVNSAHFQVVELRGFEKFLIGSAVEEALRITPRICGICPVSHHVAAAKACDEIFGVKPPETGRMLRELLMNGQFIHSHSLHFFMLASPDFLIGSDAPASDRSVVGLIKKAPDIAKKAIEIRKFGQRLTEAIGAKPIHPSTCVPGGISCRLSEEKRSELLDMAKKSLEIAKEGWETAKSVLDKTDLTLGAVETSFVGMSKDNKFSIYDGPVNVIGKGREQKGNFSGTDYLDYIEEYSEDWSYLKFSRLKSGDYYRVGPLARLNIIKSMGTPLADSALFEYRSVFGEFTQTTLAYNIARYIELLSCCENAVTLLSDLKICGDDIRAEPGGIAKKRGVGIIEAPRGTLIHDYTVDDNGFITKCNLIVATCQNNYAMDRGVEDAARKVISGGVLSETASNRIETVIRAYDPCISCATHAIGKMPISIEVLHDRNKPEKGPREI